MLISPDGGGLDGVRAREPPGSVGTIACRWRPHCWQYAKPSGVAVPQRGQLIVLPCATRAPLGGVAAMPAAVEGWNAGDAIAVAAIIRWGWGCGSGAGCI